MDKKRYPRAEAMVVAAELVRELRPLCHRLIVAGSLRRQKAEVGDIEIVYIPSTYERQKTFFEKEIVSQADERIQLLLEQGILTKRPNIQGGFTWGELNKLAVHAKSGIPVDLFRATEDRWWMTVVIRTGPKNFNVRLIAAAAKLGLKLHAYGVYEDCDGQTIIPKSEQEVFELAGMEYAEPAWRL